MKSILLGDVRLWLRYAELADVHGRGVDLVERRLRGVDGHFFLVGKYHARVSSMSCQVSLFPHDPGKYSSKWS
jgi:hypothetical protein